MGIRRSIQNKRSSIGRVAMVERIACFLTCGYTEAGAMQFFLRKLNDRYEYKQYLPNKTIKKKGILKVFQKKSADLRAMRCWKRFIIF